jgi:predicted nuclease with TOPRIM domain
MLWTKVVSLPRDPRPKQDVLTLLCLSVLGEYNVPFERLRNIEKQMSQLSNDLKRTMDECKDIYTKNIERLQRERDTALIAASQIEDPNNINAQLPPGVEISNKKVSLTAPAVA